MESPQTNLFRYERKYLLKKINLNKFLAELYKNNFKKIYKKRFINNIYYDTYNYDLLSHNIEGLSERKKIRIRWYGKTFGLSKKTIELKIKSEFLNTKKSLSIGKFKINSLEEITKFNNYVTDNLLLKKDFRFYNEIVNKIPVILNRYKRSYFISLKNDVRVTIDSDLNFYSPITKIKSFEKNIIVEIKYKSDIDFSNNFNNLTITRYSKYAQGLLQNTFYKPIY